MNLNRTSWTDCLATRILVVLAAAAGFSALLVALGSA